MANISQPPPVFVTVSELARNAGAPINRALRRIEAANVAPDGFLVQGLRKSPLFAASRADELAAIISAQVAREVVA